MSAPPLDPPRTDPTAGAAPGGRPTAPDTDAAPDRTPEWVRLLAAALLLIAAAATMTRVFVGPQWIRPVAAAIALPLGLAWGARRLGAGPIGALCASTAGWGLFVAIAFLPDTLIAGVLPTRATPTALVELWTRGVELVRVRPAPVFAESGIMLLTVTGTWAIAHVVEALVVQLRAPLRATGVALVLWAVPLAIVSGGVASWPLAAAVLAAAAFCALVCSGDDLLRWGRWAGPTGGSAAGPFLVTGAPVAAIAIVIGAVVASALPGFGEPAWVTFSSGGTTLTENPIVGIRSRLVDQSTTEVMRVSSPQPTYLRLTALDVYAGDREEWTSAGIQGRPTSGRLDPQTPTRAGRDVDVDVEAQSGLEGALLIPAPYQPRALGGDLAGALQYDQRTETVTMSGDQDLVPGDSYTISATLPAPEAGVLADPAVGTFLPGHPLTELPDAIPDPVTELAAEIVAEADATSPFEVALAIQDELRTWDYSLDPPSGHDASAMVDFITNRIGYCEQFAGTMAVMLRSLDVPARVAVGYTPGDLRDDTYVVTGANAHAWVEVFLTGVGWIAFEPTPRSDDNVLVPSAVDVAPTQMESGGAGTAELELDPTPTDEALVPDVPEVDDAGPDVPPDLGGGAGGADGASEGGMPGALTWLAVAALAAVGLAAVTTARRRAPARLVPAARVTAARDRVRRTADGVSKPRRPSDTDREHLLRIRPHNPDAVTLADACDRAVYATTVPADLAASADAAADRICRGLLRSLSPAARLRARVRMVLAPVRRVAARVRPPRRDDD